MSTKYAPVVIFGFNRPQCIKKTIESLLQNRESRFSDLYVFVDGPRKGKVGELEKIQEVQNIVKDVKGFNSLHYTFSETNKGLALSVIEGVTQVLDLYGKVIVLEDDLLLAPNFLNFMNQGLDFYEHCTDVMSVCGHSCKVNVPKNYPYDAYFLTRSSSWGWATWKDRWEDIDWKLDDWVSVERNKKSFVKSQGSDVFGMLSDWKKGKNNS